MPRGICKLCLEEGDLQESHFIPRALYRGGKKGYVFLMRDGSSTDREELKAHLLCFECEQRLSRDGESEVLRHVAPKSMRRFPLYERMRVAYARDTDPSSSRFAAYDFGVDVKKFAYFAMSIVWRRTIHDWMLPNGTVLPRWELGNFAEQMRRYLRGETEFPSNSAVIVIVCSDPVSRRTWNLPVSFVEANCLNFRFLVRGIVFRVMMGSDMPQYFRDYSCLSARQCIFYGDCEKKTSEVLKIFSPKSDTRNGLVE